MVKHRILFLTVIASVLLCASVLIWLFGSGAIVPGFGDNNDTVTETWQDYIHPGLPIYLQYLSNMGVYEREDGVAFNYIGPSQAENTELYDGISFNISMIPREEGDDRSVEELAKEVRDDAAEHGEIIDELSETTLADQQAYRFVLDNNGNTITSFVVAPSPTDIGIITYIAPDPDSKNYQEKVDTMLGSVKFSLSQ